VQGQENGCFRKFRLRVLYEMKRPPRIIWGRSPQRAVITVPAAISKHSQRRRLQDAGSASRGLEAQAHIMSRSGGGIGVTAFRQDGGRNSKIAVYDLGAQPRHSVMKSAEVDNDVNRGVCRPAAIRPCAVKYFDCASQLASADESRSESVAYVAHGPLAMYSA